MKALSLIKRLVYDSRLAEEGGTMTMWPLEDATEDRFDAYCAGYFGTQMDGDWSGQREAGSVYFYLYVPLGDEEWWYSLVGEEPDAYCVRSEEGDVVALWKIE